MRIAIGADHAGYELKQHVGVLLSELRHEWHDLSIPGLDPEDDYPDVAQAVAWAVARGEFHRGILICGTGIGVCITANKVPGIRAALCGDTFSARSSREHNDANVLCLGGRVLGPGLAADIVRIWLETGFSAAQRHARRVEKMAALDRSRKV